MDRVALIDFEASCLPAHGASFPIEVALARTDGSSHTWLIRPHPRWEHWDWTQEAEDLHGITRKILEKDGEAPEKVLAELAEAADGCDVFADAELDAYWLEVLASAVRKPVPFPIRFLGELFVERGFTREQVTDALDEAKAQLPREHVARDDAKRLALAVRLLLESREETAG